MTQATSTLTRAGVARRVRIEFYYARRPRSAHSRLTPDMVYFAALPQFGAAA